MDFDKNLGVFQIEEFKQWQALSSHISPFLMLKLYENIDMKSLTQEKIQKDIQKSNKIDLD